MSTTNRNIFRFFDLPAELQDMIYDRALTVYDTQHCCLKAHVESIPWQARLVSHKFSSELVQRTQMIISEVGLVSPINPNKFGKCMFKTHEFFRCSCRASSNILKFKSAAYQVARLQINVTASSPGQVGRYLPLGEGLLKRMHNLQQSTFRINALAQSGEAEFMALAISIQDEYNGGTWGALWSFDSVQVHWAKILADRWNFEIEDLQMERNKTTGMMELV